MKYAFIQGTDFILQSLAVNEAYLRKYGYRLAALYSSDRKVILSLLWSSRERHDEACVEIELLEDNHRTFEVLLAAVLLKANVHAESAPHFALVK